LLQDLSGRIAPASKYWFDAEPGETGHLGPEAAEHQVIADII